MRKAISLFLVFVLCLSLCACGEQNMGRYENLIGAIESNNYEKALVELQNLMGKDPAETPEETTPEEESCVHSDILLRCEEKTYCDWCGQFISEALGHEYVEGSCIRCGQEDPAEAQLRKQYDKAMKDLQSLEKGSSIYMETVGYVQGNKAAQYVYEQLVALGEYKDCRTYLERFTVISDVLLYIKMNEKDNFGNFRKNADLRYEYDTQGRVILSEETAFLNRLGVLLNTYASGTQNYVTITYGEDGRIAEYKLYYVSLREIITPAYDEKGRIQSVYHQENVGGYTTYFYYDSQDRLIKIQNGTDGAYLEYHYNANGTLAKEVYDDGENGYIPLYENKTKTYLYDGNNKLIGWEISNATTTVEFDSYGRTLMERIVTVDGVAVNEYVYGNWYIYTPANSQ